MPVYALQTIAAFASHTLGNYNNEKYYLLRAAIIVRCTCAFTHERYTHCRAARFDRFVVRRDNRIHSRSRTPAHIAAMQREEQAKSEPGSF